MWYSNASQKTLFTGLVTFCPSSFGLCAVHIRLCVKWKLYSELEGDSSDLADLLDLDKRFSPFL